MNNLAKLDEEEIQQNWEIFCAFTKKTGEYNDRQEKISLMITKYENRIAICPASNNVNYHCAYPGGLVEHSLNVLKFALKIRQVVDSTVSQESLIMSALFHDLGKIGDNENDYYVDQNSSWHKEKGMIYKYNEKLSFMPVAQRSLYLLQFNGITLTKDEFTAILIHDGQYTNENKSWAMKEPTLAIILHQADMLAIKKEKEEL